MEMLNRKVIREMQKELKSYDEDYDRINNLGHEIIRVSKKIIYAMHRNATAEAKQQEKRMIGLVNEVKLVASSHPELKGLSIYRTALQEYVEAECFFSYITTGKILDKKKLETDTHAYLSGLCDLSGELFRLALHSSINGDFDRVKRIGEVLSSIYTNLLEFSFRDSELRHKMDKVRYDLEKLEAMLFEIQKRG